ncbi:serine/threonine protein kinase with TPR repeats [Richelia sinica FACHB-800]|uniref:Serine/threonine protein kinase with TPR repeats n=1 Tax=Richelia sinica FACHB-800 TaxID=1357546 RepID=A0A975Y3M1_9NOST|nr:serine/threonine-protein kinase [Richelia sinica]MBD2664361.1 tetratricopeptide repeat protein [Richelia sinica FACHB-800]QXE22242.1 serine/threonine protein kinase with TPR repeats [Richelia sinica FACHB-800]
MLGNTLTGRYQIISHLGGGGFGETYVAHDTQLPGAPPCVVKRLKPQANDPTTLETARRLFDTEAQVLYKLGNHDRIPQLLAYFEENAEFYLVQEFIVGHDLSQELIPGKLLNEGEVISWLKEILEILDFVHQQQVIHRDVNPRNILRRKTDGRLILIDFGAVKQIATQAIASVGETKFTVAIGTPGFIPSEQAQGTPKLSSDIYALGIIAIQALTGLAPEQLEKDVETNEIVWKKSAQVSPELAQFIDIMVRYDFRQRYASATVALQALNHLTANNSRTVIVTPLAPITTPVHQLKQPGLIWKVTLSVCFIGAASIGSIFVMNRINSHSATELFQQGNTLLQLQRYEEALALYEKAVNIKPNYPQGWYGQGKTLFELKQYSEALKAYDQAIQLQPDYLEAWINRGFTLIKLQRYIEAISAFDKALQFKNNDPSIWNAKGDAFRNLKQYDQGIKAYEQAIELQPDNYQFWYNKGLILQNIKQYEEAINAYNKTVELKPDYAAGWYNKGNSLVNLNRYEDAFQAYDQAVAYQPNNYVAWLSRGNVLITLRRYGEAISNFEQIIKADPDNYQAWYYRGWALHQSQRYAEAIESYQKAIAINKKDYKVWYNLGNSQYNLQKYAEAIASYNQAVLSQPNHYESWYSRGNALLNMRRYQDAIASYNQALKYKPDYQQAINGRNEAQNQLQAETSPRFIIPIPNPKSTQ